MRDAGKRLIQSAHEAAAMAKGTPPMTQDPQFTAEKLARRIIELDPDPAAVELAAHLKRQFDVGFNAGIEAARKEMDAAANSIELMCLNGGIRPPDEVIVLASAVKMVRDKANTISALTVPSDLVAVPREPSEAMKDAGIEAGLIHNEYGEDVYLKNPDAVFRAMLSAYEKEKGNE